MAGFVSRVGAAVRAFRGGRSASARGGGRLMAGQPDASRTTDDNKKHWRWADGLDATATYTPDVRRQLRNRARYEVENNCYAARAVQVLTNDTVGSGPRLQVTTDDPTLNTEVERLWREWSKEADWTRAARLIYSGRLTGGETFGVPYTSAKLEAAGLPVPLAVRVLESDQVADPMGGLMATMMGGDDGVTVDDNGEPVAYRVLKAHPGSNRIGAGMLAADDIPADAVMHWYVPTRPGQLRGVTPLAPALEIFAQLRRFAHATLSAAEFAAMVSGILETDMSADEMGAREVKMWDRVEIDRNALLATPHGWKANAFDPKQPTTNYDMFVSAKLRECGAALNMPFGKMVGDHSRYNYSSGRLDDAPYWSDREIERQAFEVRVLEPLLRKWLAAAVETLPKLRAFGDTIIRLPHVWHYDARPSADPVKDGNADEINLTNGSDTLAGIAARDGTTVEALVAQRKREMEMFQQAGLPLPPWLAGQTAPVRTGDGPPAANQPGVANG